MNTKISSIQALRGLAAVAVVGFHSIGVARRFDDYVDHPLINLLEKGWIGLDVFFVLSGYLIAKITFDFVGWGDALAYLKLRIVRIVPAYWTLTCMMIAIIAIYPRQSEAMDLSLLWVLSSLFFFPYFEYGKKSPILFIGWTLNYEMLFYFVVFFGIVFRSKWLALAAISALGVTGVFFVGSNEYWKFISNPIMLEFVIGFMLFQGGRWLRIGATPTFIGGMLGGGGLIILLHASEMINESNRAILGIPIALIIFALINPSSAGLSLANDGLRRLTASVRSMMLIGDSSYSIYLIQAFSLPFCYRALDAAHLAWLGSWLICLLVIVITVFCGLIFFLLVERPMLRFLRGRIGVCRGAGKSSA